MAELRVDGKRLRQLREAYPLTQGQLAAKTGLKQDHISKIETGKRPSVRFATLDKLAKALSVPASELLEGKGGAAASALDLLNPRLKGYLRRLANLPPQDQEMIANMIGPFIEREEREPRERRSTRREQPEE